MINDDSKIEAKNKDIMYANSVNGAIEIYKSLQSTTDMGIKPEVEIIHWRDWFYSQWVEWKNDTDKRAKEADECPHELCPKCASKVKKIPAGISKKSGNPYQAFWACSKKDCDWTWNADDEERAKKSDAEDRMLDEENQKNFLQRQKLNN